MKTVGRNPAGKNRAHSKGFLLLTSLGVVVFLTLSGASLLVDGISASNISARMYNRSNAFQLAEAGINQAGLNLRTQGTSDDVMSGTLASGTFQIDKQESIANSQYWVQATGTSQLETRQIETIYQVNYQSVFQFAVFADQQVQLSGSLRTDSYDSRLGAYDPNPGPTQNISHDGDVGTNSVALGGVDMSGGSLYVDGQLKIGPDVASPTTQVTGFDASLISGGTSPASNGQDVISMPTTMPLAPVVIPGGLTCNDLTVNASDVVTLSPTGGPLGDGSYCYHDLQIEGSGTFNSSGSVKVYLTGELKSVGNTLVGTPSDPTRMIFYMSTASIATIEGTISGTSDFYAGLYAPQATIALGGNSKVFGAVTAGRVYVAGNAEIHYDEAMASITQEPGFATTVSVAWREL